MILPRFVYFVLPRYSPGIVAGQLSSFLGFAMGMYLFDNIYNVIKRQDLYIVNWCCGCVSFVLIWYCLARYLYVAQALASAGAMLTATFVMALISAIVSRKACLAHDRCMKTVNLKY